MAIYIVLSNFTDQGIKAVKDTTKRAEAFRTLAKAEWRHHQGSVLDR